MYWGMALMFVAPFAYFDSLVPEVVRPDSNYLQLLEVERIRQHLANGQILPRYFGTLFGMEWGFIGVFATVALPLGLVRGGDFARQHWPSLLYCVAPFSVYLLAFHVSPFDATWHLDTALLRLQSQFVPIWCFAAATILLQRRPVDPDLRNHATQDAAARDQT